ncbi:hypothetical protein AAC387_Pa02g0620 [Persea americana]
MSVELENSASGDASVSSSGPAAPAAAAKKKKRSLPGMPDPDAEVIALSPKTLMATNRFVCEICNKGFQRDQNLQLHRRGHNLPWKLRQRSGKEVRKRVYVCPEPSCVHHDPSRALGDLTGIKKHFCRKHGEKKWKCDKCSKKYAVQSDWKAHLKTCGTREYRCDCGTLFSRRDSFITHRAFCDALAEESAKVQTTVANSTKEEEPKLKITAPVAAAASGVLPVTEMENGTEIQHEIQMPQISMVGIGSSGASDGSNRSLFASLYTSPSAQSQSSTFSDLMGAMTQPDRSTTAAPPTSTEPPSLCLSSNGPALFSPPDRRQFAPPQPAHMSATALLQKAAQMGAAATSSSLFRGFGLGLSSSTSPVPENMQWDHSDPSSVGMGLGHPGMGLSELMMGQSIFGAKPATLDLLGLGMGIGGAAPGGLSALITSIGNGLDVAASFGGGGNSPGKS